MAICHVLKMTAASPPVNERSFDTKYQLIKCDSIEFDPSKCSAGKSCKELVATIIRSYFEGLT